MIYAHSSFAKHSYSTHIKTHTLQKAFYQKEYFVRNINLFYANKHKQSRTLTVFLFILLSLHFNAIKFSFKRCKSPKKL